MTNGNERLAVVFGANGSIGKAILAELQDSNITARAVVRPGKEEEVRGLAAQVQGVDLNSNDQIASSLVDASEIYYTPAVFHQGRARGSLIRKISEGEAFAQSREINIDLPLTIHHAAENQHIPRFIYISSIAVYGKRGGELTEDSPTKPNGIYGVTKKIAEDKLREAQNNTTITIVRPANVLGPGAEIWSKVLFKIFSSKDFFKSRFITGNGEGNYPFVDIRDVARAMVLAAGNANAEDQIYNLASSDTPTLQMIAEYYETLIGFPPTKTNHNVVQGLGHIFDAYSYLTGKPALFVSESVKNLGDKTRYILNDKAKKDLHMGFRSTDDTMRHTINWLASPQVIFDATTD